MVRIDTGSVLLTCIDARGEPARGRWLRIENGVTGALGPGHETDGDGMVRAVLAVGEWTVVQRMQPRGYVPRDRLLDVVADARIVLGTVAVCAGETTRATFVLADEPR